jgi:hypothetical protein
MIQRNWTVTKVEVQDYEVHNLAECSRHSQEQLRLCMGMSQAIAELSNVLAHKFNSLQWTLDQLQSQSGTLSAALPSMQEQAVFGGSTGGLIAASPSETPSRGTNASVPSGKPRRRGRLPAHTSSPSTRAAVKTVRTKGRSRRQSSLVEGTDKHVTVAMPLSGRQVKVAYQRYKRLPLPTAKHTRKRSFDKSSGAK